MKPVYINVIQLMREEEQEIISSKQLTDTTWLITTATHTYKYQLRYYTCLCLPFIGMNKLCMVEKNPLSH